MDEDSTNAGGGRPVNEGSMLIESFVVSPNVCPAAVTLVEADTEVDRDTGGEVVPFVLCDPLPLIEPPVCEACEVGGVTAVDVLG